VHFSRERGKGKKGRGDSKNQEAEGKAKFSLFVQEFIPPPSFQGKERGERTQPVLHPGGDKKKRMMRKRELSYAFFWLLEANPGKGRGGGGKKKRGLK